MRPHNVLIVLEDEAALATEAAERVTAAIGHAVDARGNALISLTGGDTPRRLYTLLGRADRPWRARIEWRKVRLFWGDERHVPPDHADSNFGMAWEALVRHVPVPPEQVHRMRGEMEDARAAAQEYDRELRAAFAAAGRTDLTFDLMLLGLGEDAHIASIFPASELLTDSGDARTAGVWAPHLNAWRITLTPAAILDAHVIVMVVSGAAKAHAVRAALEAADDVQRYPAQLLRAAGDRVVWLVDRAAAEALESAR